MQNSLFIRALSAVGLLVFSLSVAAVANADPVEAWVARYDGPAHGSDSFWDIAIDSSSGNVYVTGESEGNGTSLDFVTIAYDRDGNELWVSRYNGPANGGDSAKALAFDPSTGNIYVTGTSQGSNTETDFATVAYDSNGNELWVKRYNGPGNYIDYSYDILFDPSTGHIVVSGFSYGNGTHYDFTTIAYDSNGNELWIARYDGPANSRDVSYFMALDPATGNVFLSGSSVGSGLAYQSNYDFATVAYDSSGNELWVAMYNGPGNDFDAAVAPAVNPSTGNVYVTGHSTGVGTGIDFATIAYDSSGNELWVKRYNGPANGTDYSDYIVVDPTNGNIYISGASDGIGSDKDYATVAYDSSGNELWVKRYNGPANSYDYAWYMALDPSTGNVYVTGESNVSSTDSDCITIAYDSSGNELWVKRYNGPANGTDYGWEITVDPSSGDVYVGGDSEGVGTDYDLTIIKYNLSSGATPSGTNVTVQPVDPAPEVGDGTNVTVTFEEVTSAGETTITSSSADAPLPTGFQLGDPAVFYSIDTTASFTSTVLVCIDYSNISYVNEADLRLLHQTGSGWEDATDPGYPDTVNDFICGTVSHFSDFAVAEPTYQFTGFRTSLKHYPAENTVRAGGNIRVMFQLTGSNGSYISDTGAVTGVWYQECSSGEMFEADTSDLRYRRSTDEFVYTWKTRRDLSGCYRLVVELYGLDLKTADFEFIPAPLEES